MLDHQLAFNHSLSRNMRESLFIGLCSCLVSCSHWTSISVSLGSSDFGPLFWKGLKYLLVDIRASFAQFGIFPDSSACSTCSSTCWFVPPKVAWWPIHLLTINQECTGASFLWRNVSRTPLNRVVFRPMLSRGHVDVFPSQIKDTSSAAILSSLQASSRVPQTMTEKIVQRHSLDLAKDQYVRAGDFVTLSPHKCMTHGKR